MRIRQSSIAVVVALVLLASAGCAATTTTYTSSARDSDGSTGEDEQEDDAPADPETFTIPSKIGNDRGCAGTLTVEATDQWQLSDTELNFSEDGSKLYWSCSARSWYTETDATLAWDIEEIAAWGYDDGLPAESTDLDLAGVDGLWFAYEYSDNGFYIFEGIVGDMTVWVQVSSPGQFERSIQDEAVRMFTTMEFALAPA